MWNCNMNEIMRISFMKLKVGRNSFGNTYYGINKFVKFEVLLFGIPITK